MREPLKRPGPTCSSCRCRGAPRLANSGEATSSSLVGSPTTAAFADNGPSTGVTRKLGYEPNGVGWHERRGQRAEINRFVMSRQHFLDHIHRDDIEIEGDAEVRDFLGIARTD